MEGKPQISIIVPVYKAERYLHNCLDSIIAQTFTDFELILVDDGSPDNSGAICENYALKDPRVKVIHKKNGGASTARKVGIEAARGRYIGWVDADDRIESDMYSVLYNLIEKYNADIVECQYYLVDGEKMKRSGKEGPVLAGSGDLILHEFFSTRMKPDFWSKLYRAELLKMIKFPDRQIHVDFYVNVQFALRPLTYVRTSDVKYYYYVRENSNITTYNSRAIREALYKYDFTMDLAANSDSELAAKYLKRDAVNRLMGRYFTVSVNSNIKDQRIYNYIIKKKVGVKLFKYLLVYRLPLKTRISYALLLLNLKGLQRLIHTVIGKK